MVCTAILDFPMDRAAMTVPGGRNLGARMRKVAVTGLLAGGGILALLGAVLALKPTAPTQAAYDVAKGAAQSGSELVTAVASVLPGGRAAATPGTIPAPDLPAVPAPTGERAAVIAQAQRPASACRHRK